MQKIFTRAFLYSSNFFSSAPVRYFLLRSLHFGTLLSGTVYITLKIIFHDFPVAIREESELVLRLLLTGWLLAAVFMGVFRALVYAADTYAAKLAIPSVADTVFPGLSAGKPFIGEYNLFKGNEAFSIDKTGRLRYRVRIIEPGLKTSENDAAGQVKKIHS